MTKTRWRKDMTPDGVVTHTDPTGRVVIEKHTHHYGPWLVKDLDLDERVAETEVSEAEAKRLAEDYLASPRPVPSSPYPASPRAPEASRAPQSAPVERPAQAPLSSPAAAPEVRGAAMAYAAAVQSLVGDLRALADEVERRAVPGGSSLREDLTPHASSADAVQSACVRALSGSSLTRLASLAAQADIMLDRSRSS